MRVLCRPVCCFLLNAACVIKVIHTLFHSCVVQRIRVCVCVCTRACAVCPLSYACSSVPVLAYIFVHGLNIHRETSVITSRASLKLPQYIRLHGTPRAVVYQILCQHILYVNSEIALAACQFWHTCNGASMYLTIWQLCHILAINHISYYESNPIYEYRRVLKIRLDLDSSSWTEPD